MDISYRPTANGAADPGEVVWAWVPYEEDSAQGKDRPVLVVAVEGESVFGLPMTSKDHDRDAEQEARAGRLWMDIGSGPWDPRGRPGEVRLNRVVQLDGDNIRREGAAVNPQIFAAVVSAMKTAP